MLPWSPRAPQHHTRKHSVKTLSTNPQQCCAVCCLWISSNSLLNWPLIKGETITSYSQLSINWNAYNLIWSQKVKTARGNFTLHQLSGGEIIKVMYFLIIQHAASLLSTWSYNHEEHWVHWRFPLLTRWVDFTQRDLLTRPYQIQWHFMLEFKSITFPVSSFILNFLMNVLHIFKYAPQP